MSDALTKSNLSAGASDKEFQIMKRTWRHAKNRRAAAPQDFSSWKTHSHNPVFILQAVDY
jgi:hypothetical protein